MTEKESEAQRRAKVAEEKLYGYLIESIERSRKNPIAMSLVIKIYSLFGSIKNVTELINIILSSIDPIPTNILNDIGNRANNIINTYNDIIYDLQSNFRRRDAQIGRFSKIIKELESPTLNDINMTIIIIIDNLGQILGHLTRWIT